MLASWPAEESSKTADGTDAQPRHTRITSTTHCIQIRLTCPWGFAQSSLPEGPA